MTRFTYTPLPEGDNVARVFDLLPGDFDSPLEVEMKVCDLTATVYEAVSYVWHTGQEPLDIICNSGSLTVPGNLTSALRYLRLPDKRRRLWADSICINQQDNLEKSTQVGRMGTIYATATLVLMWLGEPDDQAPGELAAFEQVEEAANDEKSPQAKIWSPIVEEWSRGYPRERSYTPSGIDFRALISFMRRPYFRRLWIAQEIILARHALMLIGRDSLSWNRVQEMSAVKEGGWSWSSQLYTVLGLQLCESARDLGQLDASSIHAMENTLASLAYIGQIWSERLSQGNDIRDLMKVLMMMCSSDCTDPRDGIYAILSLVGDVNCPNGPHVEIDYSLGVGQVYTRVAVVLLVEQKKFDWITFAAPESSHDTNARLTRLPPSWTSSVDAPSWVPLKFTPHRLKNMRNRGAQNIYAHDVARRYPGFAAGAMANLDPVVSVDGKSLSVNGVFVDTVGALPLEMQVEKFLSELGGRTRAGFTPEQIKARTLAGQLGILGSTGLFLCLWLVDVLVACYGSNWDVAEITSGLPLLLGRIISEPMHFSIPQRAKFLEELLVGIQQASLGKLQAGWMSDEDQRSIWHLCSKFTAYLDYPVRRTSTGNIGMFLFTAQEGDRVCVLHGVSVPMILRSLPNGTYRVVGDAALVGFMDGEALSMPNLKTERITLV